MKRGKWSLLIRRRSSRYTPYDGGVLKLLPGRRSKAKGHCKYFFSRAKRHLFTRYCSQRNIPSAMMILGAIYLVLELDEATREGAVSQIGLGEGSRIFRWSGSKFA